MPGRAPTPASKGAVLGLMRAAAAEGRARDLKINAICPGFAPSNLSRDLSENVSKQRASKNLLDGSDASQSLAATCLWLLESRITGQIVRPDCRI